MYTRSWRQDASTIVGQTGGSSFGAKLKEERKADLSIEMARNEDSW